MKKTHPEVKEGHKPKKELKLAFIILSILIVISIIASLLIIIQVPYQSWESYTEKEPYNDHQCQNVNLKAVIEWGSNTNECTNQICDSSSQVCTDKNFWGNCVAYSDVCNHYACTKYRYYCNLNIQNIDDAAGTWTVSGYYVDSQGQSNFVQNSNVYVQPTRTAAAGWNFLADAGESIFCTYEDIVYPTKQVCNQQVAYRDVTKTRTITKYCNAWQKLAGWCDDEVAPAIA